MKILVTLLLITCSLLANAQSTTTNQPLDILFIAASHDYGSKSAEDFSYPINKALAFKPDAVFGENLSPEDYDALDRHWNKENIDKRLAYLIQLGYKLPKNSRAFIAHQYKVLREYPYYHQERMKLAHALFLTHDFGNASYQFYLLDKMRPAFGKEEIAALITQGKIGDCGGKEYIYKNLHIAIGEVNKKSKAQIRVWTNGGDGISGTIDDVIYPYEENADVKDF